MSGQKIFFYFNLCIHGSSFYHWRHEKRSVQVPQQNEILSLYCTELGFVGKNEEYNLE